MESAVRFENVSKRYRLGAAHTSLRESITGLFTRRSEQRNGHTSDRLQLWALKETSFSIPPGHALGLIGPNGAGKTTVLKILAKIVEPTAGRVFVNGRTSALIELGAGFHPELTGRENVYLNAAILGLSKREVSRLFDRIVAFSGLEKFIDTPVKRYSSGMYVRLGFSVAAHVAPDVLLVDEVLAVGDAQFRQKCADRIEELRKLGTTIVLVAHNLFLVKSICDLGIFLADGEVKAQGDILTAIKAYEAWLHRKQTEPSGLGGKRNDEVAVQPDSGLALTEVELRKLDGSSIEIINFDEGLQVQLHYAAVHPVRQANLVLRIVRSDGVTCCMIRSGDYGFEIGDLEGQGIISLAIDPIQLSGGAYTIDARLTGSVDGVPLAQAHSKWFQIAGLSISHTEGSGVFVPKVAWVQTQAAGAVAIAD